MQDFVEIIKKESGARNLRDLLVKLEFLFPGKTRESYLAAGIEDFHKRLRHYAQADIKIIKGKKWSNKEPEAKIKEEEGGLLLAGVQQPSLIIALDRAGHQVSSEDLAALLTQWEEQGRRSVSFLIGGPLGLSETVLRQAEMTLALSRMTFTHEMARLLLLEQVYRAYSIKAGTGYHK